MNMELNSALRLSRYVVRRLGALVRGDRPERAKNPYATHLPILVGIARLLKVKRVLELGCGQYSTSTFLDRSAFPDLITLHSLENDRHWIEKMSEMIRKDPRASLSFVDGPMSSAISGLR